MKISHSNPLDNYFTNYDKITKCIIVQYKIANQFFLNDEKNYYEFQIDRHLNNIYYRKISKNKTFFYNLQRAQKKIFEKYIFIFKIQQLIG